MTKTQLMILMTPVILFSLTVHEYSHGKMAFLLGDNTAERLGRLSFNPIRHLDIAGVLFFYFVGFGWAKPVPVDSRNLRNPRKDMMKVAAAGPLSNLLLAMLAGMAWRLLGGINFLLDTNFPVLIFYFTQINIALAVFNLIPVSPLDGSQIFSGYLMKTNPELALKIQSYGPQVLFGLILFGYVTGFSILWLVMKPFVNFFMLLFIGG